MKTNIVKTGAFCLGGVIGAVMAVTPATAFAAGDIGWSPDEVFSSSNMSGVDGLTTDNINQTTIFNWVRSITNWAFGIAVVLFVLRVVLTGIDRMVFDPDKSGGNGSNRSGGGQSVLTKIPIIGAYDSSFSIKDIFVNFGKNVAIVAGVWFIIQVITGIAMFAFSAVMPSLS